MTAKQTILIFKFFVCAWTSISAGKMTTNEELEEMLEHGNSAVFTQGVSIL